VAGSGSLDCVIELSTDLKKWWKILAHFSSGKMNGRSRRKIFDFVLRCKVEARADHSSDV
jgi:hypothetical protein